MLRKPRQASRAAKSQCNMSGARKYSLRRLAQVGSQELTPGSLPRVPGSGNRRRSLPSIPADRSRASMSSTPACCRWGTSAPAPLPTSRTLDPGPSPGTAPMMRSSLYAEADRAF